MKCIDQQGRLKLSNLGLPWWFSGQVSTCQHRGHGFDPWSRKIPHASGLLSWCTTTTEPECCNHGSWCALLPWAPRLEKPKQMKSGSSPALPQTESPGVAMEGAERTPPPPVARNNYKNYFKTKFIYKLVIWVVKEISRVTVTYQYPLQKRWPAFFVQKDIMRMISYVKIQREQQKEAGAKVMEEGKGLKC